MLKSIKYIHKEYPAVLWLLLASFCVVVFMVIFVLTTIDAEGSTLNTCISRCKADVLDLQQCMQDEKTHWDARPSTNFKHACMDLIRNQKLNCEMDCERDRLSGNAANNYYESDVRHFPLTEN